MSLTAHRGHFEQHIHIELNFKGTPTVEGNGVECTCGGQENGKLSPGAADILYVKIKSTPLS